MPGPPEFWSYLVSGLILLGISALLKGQRDHKRMHRSLDRRLLVIEVKLGILPHADDE